MDQSEASQDIVPVFVLGCQPLDPAGLDASDHVRARITAPTLNRVAPRAAVFTSHLVNPLVFDAERLDPTLRPRTSLSCNDWPSRSMPSVFFETRLEQANFLRPERHPPQARDHPDA